MKTGPLADAWTYGLSELPIWFDAGNRCELVEAASDGKLDELFDRRRWIIDRAANMDW